MFNCNFVGSFFSGMTFARQMKKSCPGFNSAQTSDIASQSFSERPLILKLDGRLLWRSLF